MGSPCQHPTLLSLEHPFRWSISTPLSEAKAREFYERTIARVPEVRGLRLCPNCKRCLNRDNNAANNIGLQFKRLVLGLGPIKKLDKDEKLLHKANVALECDF